MKNQVVLDWNQYVALARQTVAEGCVLLENKDQALPLVKMRRWQYLEESRITIIRAEPVQEEW